MLALLQNILFTVLPWLFVLTVVVVVHELGHFLMAKAFGVAIDRFSIGFGKTLFAFRDRSGVEWRLAALPLGGYVRFAGDAEASSSVPDADDLDDLKRRIVAKLGPSAVKSFFHFKPLWQRALVVAAGPVANFILAVVIFAGFFMTLGEPTIRPRVGAVVAGSSAEAAGFKVGDLITKLNGAPLRSFLDLSQYAAYNVDRRTTFEVRRGDQTLDLVAAARATVRPDPLFHRPMKTGLFGLSPTHDPADYSQPRLGPFDAVMEGARKTGDVLGTTVHYFGRMATGRESGDQLGGPIRTALMSKAVAESGAASGATLAEKSRGTLLNLISFSALISIGIGFMNLLPIPMLDGGHLLFYGYEAIARRPVAARVQVASYRVGLALVVGLLLFATWNDLQLPVLKILGGHAS